MGEKNIENMFSHFDGGVLHIHSNGRHLLKAISQLRGLKAIYLLDEKDNPLAFDVLSELPTSRTVSIPSIFMLSRMRLSFSSVISSSKGYSCVGGPKNKGEIVILFVSDTGLSPDA